MSRGGWQVWSFPIRVVFPHHQIHLFCFMKSWWQRKRRGSGEDDDCIVKSKPFVKEGFTVPWKCGWEDWTSLFMGGEIDCGVHAGDTGPHSSVNKFVTTRCCETRRHCFSL